MLKFRGKINVFFPSHQTSKLNHVTDTRDQPRNLFFGAVLLDSTLWFVLRMNVLMKHDMCVYCARCSHILLCLLVRDDSVSAKVCSEAQHLVRTVVLDFYLLYWSRV